MTRESMEYDVVVVGGGPAGLSSAIRLRQLAEETGQELSVCVLEKGSEIGAHILSGAIIDPKAIDELIPDWKDLKAPLDTPVTTDEFYFFTNSSSAIKLPDLFVPKPMHNKGNYVVSLGNLCRWLGEQAESMGVDIFPGFTAADILFNEQDQVIGVATGDMGRAADGSEKAGFEEGIDLIGKYTIFAEGCRGHLGKKLISKYQLDKDSSAQHYGLGIKELWDIPAEKHTPGKVIHGAGWPLSEHGASGGFFLYHGENNQVAVGLITDLNYENPYLNPYEEFQRFKHHPEIAEVLEGGSRVSYGARALVKGGLNALPRMSMPGALLVGCDAGTLNFSKIKGTHTAMKSGMIAAETLHKALSDNPDSVADLVQYADNFRSSWVYDELHQSRNFGAALHKWGALAGGAYNFLEQNIFAGKLPINLSDNEADHSRLKPASECTPIDYPKPDGTLSFDRLSSVFLSNTNHEEDQPCHLTLKDENVPVETNLKTYDAPEQRFCPAGVYEIVGQEENKPQLQINAQNCVHCKTCDIKDPTQNIEWVTPEGTGGPNYPNM